MNFDANVKKLEEKLRETRDSSAASAGAGGKGAALINFAGRVQNDHKIVMEKYTKAWTELDTQVKMFD